MRIKTKESFRNRRHYRVRNKVSGTAARPRMAVYKSNKHLYVQFIDDDASQTLASASTMCSEFKDASVTIETAGKLGQAAAEAAKGQGIETVVFDRGGFRYAGKIKALADAAREAGLTI
jgi:large subunit ribosomal protein L18